MNKWEYIIIHHSATIDGRTFSWSAIRNYHVCTLGWVDIGYNFGIEQVNDDIETLVGRPLYINGAHTSGHNMNEKGIGICVVGNYDLIEPHDAYYYKLSKLCKSLMIIFGIPIDKICPHSNFNNKTCPGVRFKKDFHWWAHYYATQYQPIVSSIKNFETINMTNLLYAIAYNEGYYSKVKISYERRLKKEKWYIRQIRRCIYRTNYLIFCSLGDWQMLYGTAYIQGFDLPPEMLLLPEHCGKHSCIFLINQMKIRKNLRSVIFHYNRDTDYVNRVISSYKKLNRRRK